MEKCVEECHIWVRPSLLLVLDQHVLDRIVNNTKQAKGKSPTTATLITTW